MQGGVNTEGPIDAMNSTVDIGKVEDAGTEIFVTTPFYDKLYIKALRASDANNSSYYFDGLYYSGKGQNNNALPLAKINLIIFGYNTI
jgi:hypothetical protein